MIGKLFLTLATTFALSAVIPTKSAHAEFKDTCGTSSSVQGCKNGGCNGGDEMVHGVWQRNAAKCGSMAVVNPNPSTKPKTYTNKAVPIQLPPTATSRDVGRPRPIGRPRPPTPSNPG
jgi:hypothetical protein